MVSPVGVKRVTGPEQYTQSMGRCLMCRAAYCWTRKAHRMADLICCPRCGGPLDRTSRVLRSVAWYDIDEHLVGIDRALKALARELKDAKARRDGLLLPISWRGYGQELSEAEKSSRRVARANNAGVEQAYDSARFAIIARAGRLAIERGEQG